MKAMNNLKKFRTFKSIETSKRMKISFKTYHSSTTSKPKQEKGSVTVICIVHHLAGHSEQSEVTVPYDINSSMNDIQKQGAAITYAQRYAFCNAFGIAPGEDDDAQSLNPKKEENKKTPEIIEIKENKTNKNKELENFKILNRMRNERKISGKDFESIMVEKIGKAKKLINDEEFKILESTLLSDYLIREKVKQ